MASHTPCCGVSFWIYILIIFGLVLFAGLMSGLTLGLMSLGLVDLEVLMRSGTPEDRKHAAKILPVVKNQHLLLCTLLIGNSLAMEALPIFLDSLVAAWGAILISVTLILMFGEIFPQALCTRYGLAVGAFMAPFVRVLVFFFFPVAYPISKVLDKVLGKGHVALFRRAELKTLVDMHGNEAGKGGELTHDETTIIAGALELTEKTAFHAMTPVSAIFSVDINAKLDMEMMNLIMGKGHSRIPVYSGNPSNIIGLILVKNLLAIRGQNEVLVRNLTIRKIPRVPEAMPLYDILNEFQKGHSHMAVVVRYSKEKSDSMQRSKEGSKMERRLSGRRHSRQTSDAKGVSSYKFLALDIPEGDAPPSETGSPRKKTSMAGNATPDHTALPYNFSRLTEVTMPNPVVLSGNVHDSEAVGIQKSRKREAPEVILDMSPESLLSFANDEEVVGIITMEDLIEELLQEEIWDETDQYIDVHNKIKVNLLPPGGRSPASPRSSFPPTANPSFPHTPALPSLQSSPVPQAPVSTPAWTSTPASPLVSLACTDSSHHHHQHLKILLHVRSLGSSKINTSRKSVGQMLMYEHVDRALFKQRGKTRSGQNVFLNHLSTWSFTWLMTCMYEECYPLLRGSGLHSVWKIGLVSCPPKAVLPLYVIRRLRACELHIGLRLACHWMVWDSKYSFVTHMRGVYCDIANWEGAELWGYTYLPGQILRGRSSTLLAIF